MFVNSGSFKQAQQRSEKLDMIKYMNDTIKAKLQEAVKSNSQIREAYYVPQKVQGIISSFG